MISPILLGELVTVPPMNELFGLQLVAVPFVTVWALSSPPYVTAMPPSAPKAEPGVPIVALVQSVQTVAEAGVTVGAPGENASNGKADQRYKPA